ncbi:DUF3800 domain-containing protein [Paraglaciecola arctica]|uniref:DUF3800 domain-containing protein n=1 Tax=Paraglaciecola arctica BSs20135 TaxID=493475 RepID=K6XF51_9ALTE|nr:DUF3800 domain-containing protein [Paraglaciecola arctica]GAC19269.1 hypothetical protein GARC_2302 [Paraglaciecola arctica BSs20135]
MEDSTVMSTELNDSEAKELKKQTKIEKEKKSLIERLEAGNFKQLQTKVAYILNIYPESRNSDITLAWKYWETYQSTIFNGEFIDKKDLFKLERQTNIVRARAKIQNEYRLFMANDEIRRFRIKAELKMVDSVRSDVAPAIKQVHVFSDESGKNQDYFVIGSVWVLKAVDLFIFSQKIDEWKSRNGLTGREIHFKKISNGDVERIKKFIDLIKANSSYLGFKYITVKNSELRRSQSEKLRKLHEILISKGVQHEVQSNRISENSIIKVALDDESSLDAIALEELSVCIKNNLEESNSKNVRLANIITTSSHLSNFVQIADLIASAIGRTLNEPDTHGAKKEVAEYLLRELSLTISDEYLDSDMSVRFDIRK